MKKKFVLALALALTLSLTACNKPESKPAASSPEQSVTESTPEQTPPVESEPEQTKETAPVESVPEQPEEPESVDLFTDTNETVYVTSTVDLLVDPDENSGKIGQLNWGDSVLRTGIGIDDLSDWSEIQLANGSIAYVASEYLTTTNLVEEEAARKAAEQKAQEEAARKAAEQKAQEEAARKAAEQKAQEEAARKAAEQKAQEEAARKAAEQKAQEEAAKKAETPAQTPSASAGNTTGNSELDSYLKSLGIAPMPSVVDTSNKEALKEQYKKEEDPELKAYYEWWDNATPEERGQHTVEDWKSMGGYNTIRN